LREDIRLGSVAPTEDRPGIFVKEADLILLLASSSEVSTVTFVDQREDTAADRNARSASVASLLPSRLKGTNLGGLLDVEWLTGLVEFEG